MTGAPAGSVTHSSTNTRYSRKYIHAPSEFNLLSHRHRGRSYPEVSRNFPSVSVCNLLPRHRDNLCLLAHTADIPCKFTSEGNSISRMLH